MNTYQTSATVEEQGRLVVAGVPFVPGTEVEVMIREKVAAEAGGPPGDESLLERRRALTQKFVSGEWGVELAAYEEARAVDRRKAAERAKAWNE